MKKINFRGRKHAVTATCLLVGMFMLTSAVYANYDDARGYTNYKNAVKNLAFYEENFSGTGEISLLMDGKNVGTVQGELKLDGNKQFTRTVSKSAEEEYEMQEFVNGSKGFIYYTKDNNYYEISDASNIRGNLDMKDPTMKKAIRFTELSADAMVGDLKNNFVLTSSEGDHRSYSVNVSGSQIPEVVNAGLSLMFTAANSEEHQATNMVTYDDYRKALGNFYKEQTGEEMTADMYDEWTKEVEKANEDFVSKYQSILGEKGDEGIVYVKSDGSYEYYKTYDEYIEDAELMGNSFDDRIMMANLGSDPYISNAVCNFTLDKDGNLVSNEMEATMTGEDRNGEKHTVTMKINLKVSDYGTTEVEDFDTTGKIEMGNR